MPVGAPADHGEMTLTPGRLLLIAVAAALAFGAWRMAAKPTEAAQTGLATGVTSLVAQGDRARFTVAATNLEAQRRATGSYEGAPMPDGISVVRADASAYCIQLVGQGPVAHVVGPGGGVVDGPC